jgi:dihydrofolate reductase
MIISLIAAMGQNRELGYQGKMPWHCPEDLRHFKAMTLNKPVIMGRKTYESLGKPLPQRRNIIVTHQKNYAAPCEVMHSLSEALEACSQSEEVMIIGGAQLYTQAIPFAHRLYLTFIEKSFTADTFFPELNRDEWREIQSESGLSSAEDLVFNFVTFEKSQSR